jgi:hypothetical protein
MTATVAASARVTTTTSAARARTAASAAVMSSASTSAVMSTTSASIGRGAPAAGCAMRTAVAGRRGTISATTSVAGPRITTAAVRRSAHNRLPHIQLWARRCATPVATTRVRSTAVAPLLRGTVAWRRTIPIITAAPTVRVRAATHLAPRRRIGRSVAAAILCRRGLVSSTLRGRSHARWSGGTIGRRRERTESPTIFGWRRLERAALLGRCSHRRRTIAAAGRSERTIAATVCRRGILHRAARSC